MVLPFSYSDKYVEDKIKSTQKSLAGALHKYSNPALIENEIAWEQVAKDKNALSCDIYWKIVSNLSLNPKNI